jgi:hypothetical protein
VPAALGQHRSLEVHMAERAVRRIASASQRAFDVARAAS